MEPRGVVPSQHIDISFKEYYAMQQAIIEFCDVFDQHSCGRMKRSDFKQYFYKYLSEDVVFEMRGLPKTSDVWTFEGIDTVWNKWMKYLFNYQQNAFHLGQPMQILQYDKDKNKALVRLRMVYWYSTLKDNVLKCVSEDIVWGLRYNEEQKIWQITRNGTQSCRKSSTRFCKLMGTCFSHNRGYSDKELLHFDQEDSEDDANTRQNIQIFEKNTRMIAISRSIKKDSFWRIDDRFDGFDMNFVCAGDDFFIFGNHDEQRYFGIGKNNVGQLGIGKREAYIDQPVQITYFSDNSIIIERVITNLCSAATFWIAQNGQIYANGLNKNEKYSYLGTAAEKEHQFEPVLLNELDHVMDIKSSARGSIALCKVKIGHIMNAYLRMHVAEFKFVPLDILQTICAFYDNEQKIFTKVCKATKDGWKINTFFDGGIIKIDCTQNAYFYLHQNGKLFCHCHLDSELIDIANSFRGMDGVPAIEDISCGRRHYLLLDSKHNRYEMQQSEANDFRKYEYEMHQGYGNGGNWVRIKGGNMFSYGMTDSGSHYIWNRYTEEKMNTEIRRLWANQGNIRDIVFGGSSLQCIICILFEQTATIHLKMINNDNNHLVVRPNLPERRHKMVLF